MPEWPLPAKITRKIKNSPVETDEAAFVYITINLVCRYSSPIPRQAAKIIKIGIGKQTCRRIASLGSNGN